MAISKGTKLSIALLFTSLAAGCGGGFTSSAPSYGGPGLPPSASRPLPADIPASEAQAYNESRLPSVPERSHSMSSLERTGCTLRRLSGDIELGYDIDDRRSVTFGIDEIGSDKEVSFNYEITLGPNPTRGSSAGKCRLDIR
ncbi:MAG TPA: hypothetical protein EYG18_09125 [Micavibrio sp.]|nr:hypothetical protein [Micavibrio sp.]